MTILHPDDEQLSAALDGADPDPATGRHLEQCAPCRARSEALRRAAEALRSAPAGLADDERDRLVAAALDAAPPNQAPATEIAVLSNRRPARSKWSAPMAWAVAAAAVVALVVGLGGLVRTAIDSRDASDQLAVDMSAEDTAGSGALGEAAPATTASPAANIVVITADLGEQRDVAELTGSLQRPPAAVATSPLSGQAARAGGEGSADATGAGAAVRALCAPAAASYRAGALGPALSAATLRWQGEPAEVLVFAVQPPDQGVSRQALVFRRSDCALLADPRF